MKKQQKITSLDWLRYKRNKSNLFNFDKLQAQNMYDFVSPYDMDRLYNISTSARFSSNIEKKLDAIKEIMVNRGCIKVGCGTNRIVYRPLENSSIVFKIALDKIGMNDNPAEFRNQHLLKPYVTKIFQVHQSGVFANTERVIPITNKAEFLSVADDVYELIVNKLIGTYVLEDIGTKYFMNIGVRPGFGVVILDYPYVYKLDGNKLYCIEEYNGVRCEGVIDYDEGFNKLHCEVCGKRYFARDLQKDIFKNQIITNIGDDDGMKKLNVKLVKVGDSKKSKKKTKYVNEKPTQEVKSEKGAKFTGTSGEFSNSIGDSIGADKLKNRFTETKKRKTKIKTVRMADVRGEIVNEERAEQPKTQSPQLTDKQKSDLTTHSAVASKFGSLDKDGLLSVITSLITKTNESMVIINDELNSLCGIEEPANTLEEALNNIKDYIINNVNVSQEEGDFSETNDLINNIFVKEYNGEEFVDDVEINDINDVNSMLRNISQLLEEKNESLNELYEKVNSCDCVDDEDLNDGLDKEFDFEDVAPEEEPGAELQEEPEEIIEEKPVASRPKLKKNVNDIFESFGVGYNAEKEFQAEEV